MNRVAALALSAALLSVSAARAADTLIPGKVTIVKFGNLAKFVAKPTTTFPVPAALGTGDPTTAGSGGGGGQLQKFDTVIKEIVNRMTPFRRNRPGGDSTKNK